jgi:homoserine dehydrogenase
MWHVHGRLLERMFKWSLDGQEIIDNPEVDVVVELIGGYGIAKELILKAIAAGKHVVTANKALIAVHGF